MKNLSTLLMVIVIFFGLILAVTPFMGSLLFSDKETSIQMAKSEVSRSALSSWFNAPVNTVVDVQAMRQSSQSWFSFSTSADVVRGFITSKQLQQQTLDEKTMQRVFSNENIPWWQPEALSRETWFSGQDEGRSLSLIYNEQSQRGVLVIKQNDGLKSKEK